MATTRIYERHIHDETYDGQYNPRNLTHAGMIFTGGRPRETLNGKWRFTVDQYDMGLRAGWHRDPREAHPGGYPEDYRPGDCEIVDVPSCWNCTGERYFYYEGSAWYARGFAWRALDPGERVFLRVGAAQYDTKVFVNHEFMGNHYGGSTPFFVELTGKLREENLVQLCVNNTRTLDRVPMRNTDWFNYGGLYRDVELFRLPADFIRDFRVSLAPGGSFEEIAVAIAVSDPSACDRATVRIDGLGIEQEMPLSNGHGRIVIPARPELWSPENPRLYDVSAGFRTDRVSDRVGFRTVAVRGRDILLNGEPLFLRGICVHEDDERLGKVTTERDIRRRYAHVKDLNANFVRLAHYPHHELAARVADEAGLLLWEEIPVYWAIDFSSKKTLADARNQLLELIRRDFNRASVIIWSVGNENADTDERLAFMGGLAGTAREADPTRLVSAACLVNRARRRIDDRLADHLDVIGQNEYYGWYNPDFTELEEFGRNSQPKKPVIITETGAGAPAGHHGTIHDRFTEEFMAEVYRRQVATVAGLDYVKGVSPWILYDFRSPRRVNRYQQGWNRKGLIAADKKTKKLAFEVLREFYGSR